MTDWIDHDGSSMPKHAKPEDRVEVRFRDGEEQGLFFPMTVEWWSEDEFEPSNWLWGSIAPENEIVAYRVVTK